MWATVKNACRRWQALFLNLRAKLSSMKPFVVSQCLAMYANHRMTTPPRILYCNCTYAQVVPKEVKETVLKKLCESGVAFDAVADLCEMSARQDPALKRLAEGGAVKVAACYPRAVKWLFHAAKADLPLDSAEVLNMRVQSAEEVAAALFDPQLKPNLPTGKVTKPTSEELPKSEVAA
jgi:hypothetical protein